MARVFESEEKLKDKEYMASKGLVYLGADQFTGDPVTTTAVWPGKTNASLLQKDWMLVCPLHPNCSCNYERFTSNLDFLEKETIDLDPEDLKEEERLSRLKKRYEDDREANRERLRLERIYGPISKSGFLISGAWEEKTCDHEEPENWLTNYIEERFSNP
ncbi:hypothetical protein BES34_013975 [Leptospira inadai serovar Lyme]|uniref:Uncharacterized protein n=1 Tax=Leptospira inadai serovar Lyme TaxID=293084 RepID=A0ABX4YGK0_9LEPT|nr:hypothetical protein BES34_013975 [Leptospira inadai serovar Lyme]